MSSSFKRRTPSKQAAPPPGTRTCPISTSTILTSSGIPSLDDILGGGVPLSCSLAILAPDSHSAYGELVQKYFVAQGIANGHTVCVVHDDPLSFVKRCMWMPASRSSQVDDDDAAQSGERIKIAWRYEQMKKFETTVNNLSADDFCSVFDLTCGIPVSVIDEARDAKRLIPFNLTMDMDLTPSMDECMRQMEHVLATTSSTEVVRLSILDLGSPDWGEHCPTDVLRFLHGLRRLLRQYSHGCACVSLAPHVCTDLWAGTGWVEKVAWLTDATISMSSFGADPALTTLFPSHHGLVRIHKLPAPHSIQPTSDKRSTLRGMSSSAAASGGSGENNLAFKCTRKRLIFETMHLGFEGGVAERRTTPSSNVIGVDAGVHTHVSGVARVTVELEETQGEIECGLTAPRRTETETRRNVKKGKKRVAFETERPDVYDF